VGRSPRSRPGRIAGTPDGTGIQAPYTTASSDAPMICTPRAWDRSNSFAACQIGESETLVQFEGGLVRQCGNSPAVPTAMPVVPSPLVMANAAPLIRFSMSRRVAAMWVEAGTASCHNDGCCGRPIQGEFAHLGRLPHPRQGGEQQRTRCQRLVMPASIACFDAWRSPASTLNRVMAVLARSHTCSRAAS